jgi:hypothetical protein
MSCSDESIRDRLPFRVKLVFGLESFGYVCLCITSRGFPWARSGRSHAWLRTEAACVQRPGNVSNLGPIGSCVCTPREPCSPLSNDI